MRVVALRFIFEGYKLPLQQLIGEPGLLLDHFRSVPARLGATFTPSEETMRLLSQIALTRDTTRAIELGQIRVYLCPDGYAACEFPGDVWAAKGDEQKARGCCERALAKSAANPGVREKIGKMGG